MISDEAGTPVHDSDTAPSVEPVVLAGGASTRFDDGDKAFAQLGGRSMLERVLVTVAAATDAAPVIAVRSDRQREAIERQVTSSVPVEPTFVTDAPAFDGPLAGVVAACEATASPWLFLTGCDMPLLDREAVSWVLAQCDDTPADAVVPQTDAGVEPLHACYRPDAVTAAADRRSPEAGLRALLDAMPNVAIVDAAACPGDLRRSARNINTVAALERLRAGDDEPGADTD